MVVPGRFGCVLLDMNYVVGERSGTKATARYVRASASKARVVLDLIRGLDVVSASHYDGAAATAEAALMTCRATRRERVLVSRGVHPHYREVLKTYLSDLPARYTEIPLKDGVVERDTPNPKFPSGGLS